jgi:simple sugar transport system permease protein
MIDWITLLQFATPLILAALGETVGQKGGLINIGLEGTMLAAAFFAVLGCIGTGSPWLGLVIGALGGLGMTMMITWFTVTLGADQVVVGTAANLLALGLTGTLFEARFGHSGQLFHVDQIPTWHGVDAVMISGIVAVFLVTWLLWHTGWGLALRAAGEYPQAAEAAGFSVHKLRFQAAAIGGLLGGLGGAYLSLGVVGSFAENMTGGRGFIAIAMVTFGRWKPAYVFLACLLIGYLDSLQYTLQARGSTVPFQLLIALPYVAALVVLVAVGKGTVVPAALARPYTREK